MKAFKDFNEKATPHTKKAAIIGLRGLMKTGFSSVAGKSDSIRAFDSETEAKEWLISN